jgi:myo-inositol 2-dehydrogenase / D-chiro-inositol 1-dehydrogenase
VSDVHVAVVGSGRIAGVHARALAKVARGRLVACADLDPEVAQRFAGEHGLTVLPTLADVLADPEIDAVLIATPNALHADQTIAALEAGKHVFCQKPIALTMDDAERVVAAGRTSDRVLQFGFMLRFTPPLNRVKELLDSGAIGTPIALTANVFGWEPSADWFYDPAAGGGVILDTMVHFGDLVRWLLGDVERVAAEGGAYVLDGARRHDSPDNAIVTMRHAGGAMSSMYVTWTAGHGNFRLELFGSEGSVTVDLVDRQASQLFLRRAHGDLHPAGWSYPDLVWDYGYGNEQQHFIDRISGAADDGQAATADDAAAALALVLRAQQALDDARAAVL